jgi:hypothetical protein
MVLVQADTMIDILIPVLGRPHRAAPLVQNIRATTTVDHRIIFVCSLGDDEQIIECNISDADLVIVAQFPAGPGDYAKKINVSAKLSGDWIFQGADDLVFEPNWAEAALKMADSGPGYDVVATNDLANASVKRGQFGTHCLIRRRYITERGGTADNTPGPVLWEGYDHNFVDRELCGVAQQRGVYVFARHSRVKHNHMLWRTAAADDTYNKALRHFTADQKLFYRRAHLWDYHGLSAHERKLAA